MAQFRYEKGPVTVKQKSPTDPIIKQNVCGRIRTSGTFPYTSLAGKHHKPLGHANISGWGRTRTCDVSLVTDLQSAALAARHTHPFPCAVREEPADAVRATPRGDQGESNPPSAEPAIRRSTGPFACMHGNNLLYCCCTMANVTPAGLEPGISGLRGRCPHH